MTDDVAAIARDLEAVIAAASAVLDRLRARPPSAPEANLGDVFADLVRPMQIMKNFDVSRSHLHRLCKAHRMSGDGSTGFAFWNGNRFLISLSRFERHVKVHPLRQQGTKKSGPETG